MSAHAVRHLAHVQATHRNGVVNLPVCDQHLHKDVPSKMVLRIFISENAGGDFGELRVALTEHIDQRLLPRRTGLFDFHSEPIEGATGRQHRAAARQSMPRGRTLLNT